MTFKRSFINGCCSDAIDGPTVELNKGWYVGPWSVFSFRIYTFIFELFFFFIIIIYHEETWNHPSLDQ